VQIGLFIPCYIDAFYPQAGIATLRLLEHLGLDVDYPSAQTCCGQPHFNAGHLDQARDMAQRFCKIFDNYDYVVGPSGSCVAMVRNHYPTLIKHHDVCDRTFELCEFLVEILKRDQLGAKLNGRAALHIGCHERRELKAADAVQRLVSNVHGLTILPTESDEWCCGFGGAFSAKFPELSVSMGRRKLAPILDNNLDYLISTDSSCLMHLNGLLARDRRPRPKTMHIAEVLATAVGAS